ncbi:MAG: putative transposase [Opitutaceae bacterium]
MRERFAALLPRFRQQLGRPAAAMVTCVIDRGIFSHEVFTHAIEAPDHHLITWEKNYRSGQWDPQQRSGQCVRERTRNHAADIRLYRFEYIDRSGAKNPQMRQLIVRATNPQDRTVEVGILTDARLRPAEKIIFRMFNRWTQENDFKYPDQHFGLDPITSYASVAYQRLKDQLETRQMKSGAYKALEQQAAQSKSALSKLLLAEHLSPARSAQRTTRIAALSQELKQVQETQAQTQKEVSRLETLIDQQMVRLDTRNKRLFDSVKLIARNAFHQAFRPFKRADNNYRDDHVRFRTLSQADGVLVETAEQVEAHLLPTANYPPKLEKIVTEFLAKLNATTPLMPDDSGRILRFPPAEKSGLQVAIVP